MLPWVLPIAGSCRTPAIRTAVRAVLGDPAYRDRARRMRGDIHAPPAAAAGALERLVH